MARALDASSAMATQLLSRGACGNEGSVSALVRPAHIARGCGVNTWMLSNAAL
jgi:hypothetical protein